MHQILIERGARENNNVEEEDENIQHKQEVDGAQRETYYSGSLLTWL
jgi:hypothetical protein